MQQGEAATNARGTSPCTQMDLAAVSVSSRLPDFWTDQPRHWFIQIEAILNPQKLSDQARYDIVIGKLNKEAIGQITDLLIQPPIANKFDALKERLLSIYEESATRQLKKLISEEEHRKHLEIVFESLRVTVGTNQWNQGGVTLAVSSNATHPNYDFINIKNDLGVLYTSSNIVFTNLIRPISLGFEFVDANVQAKVAGWGSIDYQGALSPQLLHLDVFTISSQQCVTDLAHAAAADADLWVRDIEHFDLCTMHPRGVGHGMCNGNSGSALVRLDRGTQIGIVSWGIPCARGAPDMFVRVSAYQSWFAQHIRN